MYLELLGGAPVKKNTLYFVSVHSESDYGAGLYIVPSDSKAPLLLERLAKEGQRKELERLDNAKCLCLDELKEERDLHKR